MKSLRRVAVVLTLVLAGLAVPTAVSAHSNNCATGRVVSIANNLAIRYDPEIWSPAITVAQKGYQYNCTRNTRYISDSRYSACGLTNETWWIEIAFHSGLKGYTYWGCLNDV